MSQARRLLLKADEGGIGDAEVQSGLAHAFWRHDPQRALEMAEAALAAPAASAEARSTALFVAADVEMQRNQAERAIVRLEELIRIRRHVVHWERLAECQLKLGRQEQAVQSLERAVEAAPARPDLYEQLSKLYDQQGDSTRAARHRERARLLEQAGR